MRTLRGIAGRTGVLALVSIILLSALSGLTHVSYAAAPDLVIQDVTWSPASLSMGDTVTFTITIKNQGDAAAGSSHVAYYIDNTYLNSLPVMSIDPGGSVVKTFSWTAQHGSHSIKAVADSDNEVTESNESNNEKTFAFSAVAPDLFVQGISWLPESPSVGDTVTFTVTVKNQGNKTANASSLIFYIDGFSRRDFDVPRIEINATATVSVSWVAQAGVHEIKAVADSKNQLIESDETDNERTISFSTAAPDLIVENLTWSPTNPSRGDQVTFTVFVKNQGAGRSGSFQLAYYVEGVSQGSLYFDAIDAGATGNSTFTWVARVGAFTIRAVADSNSQVAESDEANNESTFPFLTNAPDLIIQDITWSPENPSVGDTVTFTVNVKNQGTGRADPFRLSHYIGGSATGSENVQAIDAGNTTAVIFTWFADPGTQSIKIVADSGGTVVENDETNNELTTTITMLAPDLIVQDITWLPESPAVGDKVTFTIIVKNQGDGRAASSRLAYYINGINSGGQNVLYFNLIEAGATANSTFTWTAQVGTHDIKAVTDFNQIVAESDETNNEKTATITALAPDLIVMSIGWLPEKPSPGEAVTFTITLKNQGTSKAGTSRAVYYIDGSSRGYHDVQELNTGATVSNTFTWTAETGTHTIKVVADSNDEVTESDETNNSRAATLPPPDLIVQDITWSPESLAAGDTVIFTVTTKNQGDSMVDLSRVALYVDDTYLASAAVNAVSPGATGYNTFTWTAQPGSHDIKAVADFDDAVTESKEDNNGKTVTVSAVASDLVIHDITWSLKSSPESANVTFTISVKNQGDSRAASSLFAYYIDGVYLDSGFVEAIEPGATGNYTFLRTVEAGLHELKVVADSEKAVMESDETNNEKTMTFSTIVPDLFIQSLTVSPKSPSKGDAVTFTVTIKNLGIGAADSSRAGYYIDGNLAGTLDIPKLGIGATAVDIFAWTAEAGAHEIKVVADFDGMVVEGDEANNEASLKLSPQVKPQDRGKASLPRSQEQGIKLVWWVALAGGILLIVVAVIKMRGR